MTRGIKCGDNYGYVIEVKESTKSESKPKTETKPKNKPEPSNEPKPKKEKKEIRKKGEKVSTPITSAE